jgi:hypothetical protein
LKLNIRRLLPLLVLFIALAMFFTEPLLQLTRAQQNPNRPLVARISAKNQEELQQIVKLGLDLLELRDGNDLFFLTTNEQIDGLRKQGYTVSKDDTQTELLRRQVESTTFSGGYRTVAEMRALLELRAAAYPNLAQFFIYGQSWEKVVSGGTAGNDLFGIKLTNRSIPGPKPTFFLMAAIHARELTTSELALRLIDYLLTNYGTDADVTWLLDEHLIVIVPTTNPDGRVIAQQGYYQRKNTNNTHGVCSNPPTSSNQYGIDLNRNSNFKWGVINPPTEPPCGQTYPGPTPASEPETVAIQNLIASLFPDQRGPNDSDPAPLTTTGTMLTLHSYADLVLWPWGWTSNPAPNAAQLSVIGQKYAGYNGLTPQQSVDLYPTSGTTDDWAYGELGIPAMTFEVGPDFGTCGGFFPPFSCLDGGSGGNFWARNLPAFLYAARIARTPYMLGQAPTPESAQTLNPNGSSFELRAVFDSSLNGARAIAAAEYYVDVPPWRGGTPVAMSPLDGTFNSPNETATATINLTGRHLLFVRARDTGNNWGPVRGIYSPQVCAYSINPTNQNFPAAGGTGNVSVTADAGCGWTAVSNVGWVQITSGASGSGSGTVAFAVAANPSSTPRQTTLTIANQSFTVSQDGISACAFTLNPASRTVSSSASSAQIAVSASSSSCSWTAASNDAWLSITSGSSGSGNGNVVFSFTANASSSPRQGSLTIAGQTFTVTQVGAGCVTSLDPDGVLVDSSGGNFVLRINAGTSCSWAASNLPAWVSLSSTSGTGTRKVTVSVAANGGTTSRHADVIISGQVLSIEQAGSSGVTCTYSLSANGQNFVASGGTGSVNVFAPTGCSWTAQSPASWVQITSGSSGTGNGTVGYSVAANPDPTSRSTVLQIAGQSYTVTQDGAQVVCSYGVNPLSVSYAATGGTGMVNVTTLASCSWSASTAESWLTITAGSSGTGNGVVSYSVSANASSASRQGVLQVAGQQVVINQAGAVVGCQYAVSPTGKNLGSGSIQGSFFVLTDAGCSWTAQSQASWISVVSGASGSGNGQVRYQVQANPNRTTRVGVITVNGQTFTITQAGRT